ncbi:MAG: hypothetical protein H7A45_09970 [Verrucomicrobiales bacterium]|nr:hypothetical protein [Verrucomicrobiales bacterium]
MKLRKHITSSLVVAGLAIGLAAAAYANRGNGALGTVYVSSQGLYYDTFVSAQQLPNRGPFQVLEDGVTEFGPGDPGYLGGRWWIDTNGDGERNEGDTFLLCPLLPPGRP